MSGKSEFRKAISRKLGAKADRPILIPGLLGAVVGGLWQVNVPGRTAFVYVRVHGSQSEIIEAFNDTVSPILDLAVVLTRDELTPQYYRILRRDTPKYPNWTTPPQLAYHALQHTFGGSGSAGQDILWVQKQQFVPLEVRPYTTTGTFKCFVDPEYYVWNGEYKFFSGSVTPDFAVLRPPVLGQGLFATVYLNGSNGSLGVITGSVFSTSPWPANYRDLIPVVSGSVGIPLAGILISHEMTDINWNQIYDIRAFLDNGYRGSTGTAAGTSPFVVAVADPTLPLSRRLAAGPGISLTDGGAGGLLTITATGTASSGSGVTGSVAGVSGTTAMWTSPNSIGLLPYTPADAAYFIGISGSLTLSGTTLIAGGGSSGTLVLPNAQVVLAGGDIFITGPGQLNLNAGTYNLVGGGNLYLGGHNLTVPDDGTVALLGIANIFTVGPQTIQTGADSNKGLVLKGYSTGQVGSLMEWQNSAGGVLGNIGPDGHIGFGSLSATGTMLTVGYYPTDMSQTQTAINLAFQPNPDTDYAAGAHYALITNSWKTGVHNLNTLVGNYATVFLAGIGTLGTAASYFGRIGLSGAANAGLISNGYVFEAAAPARSGGNTGTVTSLFGFYGANQGASYVTNAYGIYLEAVSGAITRNYAIYSAGGNSYHAGYFGFGQSTTPSVLLHAEDQTNTNNALLEVLRIGGRVSGTAVGAAGFGPAIALYAESATNATYRQQARIDSQWAVATDASRKARLTLSAFDTAAREGLRIEASGSEAIIGMYGVTGTVRASHIADPTGGVVVDTECRAAVVSLLTVIENIGITKIS